jgi:hypothetical protein
LGIEGNQESLGVGMGTRLVAGGGAGITAASLTYPLDLVRTRLAAQVNLCHKHVWSFHKISDILRDIERYTVVNCIVLLKLRLQVEYPFFVDRAQPLSFMLWRKWYMFVHLA